jgi:hypothetical protein
VRPGDLLDGRFELIAAAGAGGMGAIFQARDRSTGERVAIKVLAEGRNHDAARFEREARVLSELRHAGIVRYLAHGVAPAGPPWLAMEWLDGEDLAARLRRGRLSLDEGVALGVRVAETLSAVHARGIVHRDLKPGNLFLGEGRVEQVKVLDFGIAWRGDTARMTGSGVVLGTPGYLAPEQVRSGEALDARADVFALGCVLLECFTGAPAFQGEGVMAVLAKILFEEVTLAPDLPAPLAALLARMLAKDPAQRPRDGAAVAAALSALGPLALAVHRAPEAASAPLTALTEGERRLLSVVLVGRATAEETLPPSALSATVELTPTPHPDDLRRVAEAHGGHFELLHDGSSAVTIRGSGAATDLAARAARCALALRALGGDRPVSLSTGQVNALQLAASAPLGDAIDRAARLLDAPFAPGASIRVDEVTAGLLGGGFLLRAHASGLSLEGEHPGAEAARTLLGRPTSCVGRERELELLASLWAECVDEPRAQAVLVTAPAGLGKSRLAHEHVRRIQRGLPPGAQIWTGRVDSLRSGSAFGLLGQALRSGLDIREGEPLETRQRKLRARVAAHGRPADLERTAAFLGELVDTPFSDEHSPALREARKDTQLMGDQMRRAFVDFLRAETTRGPLLLVLEDLHWGDLPTVRFLDSALRELAAQPWMVLALARLEVHELFPQLWVERGLQHVSLKPLTRKASEQLVREVLGERAGPETLERLVTQADGHAFYLEELIRAVAEGKGDALPETVLAMVQARLAGLDAASRRALRAASVFGEVCWPGGVGALLGEASAAQAGAWLARLVELELLVPRLSSRFPGETELCFRHALLREGAYAMLTDDDRTLGHRLAAAWLERAGERDAMVLAEQLERGGELRRAGACYLRAAEQAIRGVDMLAAVARAERGLRCSDVVETRAALLGFLCEAHVFRHELILAVEPHAEEALRIATPGSSAWARAASARLLRSLLVGAQEAVQRTLAAMRTVEPQPGALGAIALLFACAVYLLDTQGELDDAEGVLDRFRAIVGAAGDDEPGAAGWLRIIEALRAGPAREDPSHGLASAELCAALFLRVSHLNAVAAARVLAGMNLWFLGAHHRAEPILRDVTVADEDLGVSSSVRPFALAMLLADRGALGEARAVAERLVASGQARHLRTDEGRGRWALAEVLRRAGALAEAEREALAAEEALAGAPPDQLAVTATLAAVRLAQGRSAEALATAARAMERYRHKRTCGFFRGAFTRLVHAEALLAEGEASRAHAAIAEARACLLAQAERITAPDLRRSFLDDVPDHRRTLALARAWLGA